MASGIIRIDSPTDEFQGKVASIRRGSSHLSTSNSSSSGVSSASHSPSLPPSSPKKDSPSGYTNEALHEDADDEYSLSSSSPPRIICTGVLSVNDELCIDFDHHLPEDLRQPRKESLTWRLKNYLQSKWRSLPISMLPVKAGTDQKPLSPPCREDKIHQECAAVAVTTPPPADSPQNTPTTTTAPTPISCTPVYVVILITLVIILIVGGVNTVIHERPEFLYGPRNATSADNETVFDSETMRIAMAQI